ncbi:transglutaminase domain-containing protein [Methanovulcanius yangii]|uniref:transglutaminase domain-containing protein n=1 Tax=Methanovulcanius yangii TaxID=1789227 RepID=UPI0029CA56CE|nr:transglutaminase domain-containing protein [Methanovulcanius yangii]
MQIKYILIFLLTLAVILVAVLTLSECRTAHIGGEKIISDIVEQSSNESNKKDKIEKILVFIVDDYYQTYSQKNHYNFIIFDYYGNISFKETNPRFRSIISSSDPYRAVYYNIGACYELALIFNETASKAGFTSRIVFTNCEDHFWNEVFLNDSWIHVDPTLFYHYYRDGDDYENSWFNNPEIYNDLSWYNGYSQILVYGSNEVVSQNYLNLGNLSVITPENINKIVITPNSSRRDIVIHANTSNYTISLGEKGYFVTAEKNSMNPYILYEDTGYAIIIGNESTSLYLDPRTQKLNVLNIVFTLITIVVCFEFYVIFKKIKSK